jgi:hypothetical protein
MARIHKDDCFIEVSNNDIFREVKNLRRDINSMQSKIKVSQWMSATALTLTIGVIIGFVLS